MESKDIIASLRQLVTMPGAYSGMRKFIITLASTGKLDKAAGEKWDYDLINNEISKARHSLVLSGKNKKQKKAVPIEDNELPFAAITGVKCLRLSEVAYIEKGATAIQKASSGNYPLVVTAEGRSTCDSFQFDEKAAIVPLISSTGHGHASLNRLHYQEGKFALGNILCAIIPYAPDVISARYIYEYLDAYKDELLVSKMSGTANVSLTIAKVGSTPIPLISPASQRKVDELMALCDQLEAERNAREATHQRLIRAVHHPLTDASDTATTQTSWHRIRDNFADLYTTLESVQALRQTILQLAVQGKLVSQDSANEPASQLLQNINEEKEALIKEKIIKKGKKLSEIDPADTPFVLDDSWAWVQLGDLCYKVADGPHFSPSYVDKENGVLFLSARNISISKIDISTAKYVSHADHIEFCKRVKPKIGDILYIKGGTTGVAKVNNLNLEFSVWVHLAVLQIPNDKLNAEYLALALNSPHCYSQSQRYTHGLGNKDLGLTRMIKITIPLPPLVEQYLIVAKVGELMALCDQLEANIRDKNDTAARYADAIVQQIAAA